VGRGLGLRTRKEARQHRWYVRAMPRYFFEITDGGRSYKDEVGRTFPVPEATKAHAVTIAGELAADDGWGDYVVSVRDEKGNEIARVPIHPKSA
jgi:hypothetical protein